MATGSITTSGVGSGLDVASLVSKLMSVENQAMTPLTTAASSYNTQISAYASLKSALSTFKSSLTNLTTASFSAQKATLTNSGTGTNVTTDAITAEVNTDDSVSAKGQVVKSAGITATGATFNSGDSIAFKIGDGTTTFVTLTANSTLEMVRDKINKGNLGVTASITKDDQGQHLVIESNTTGTSNTVKITGNGTLAQFAFDPSNNTGSTMTQTQAPQDQTAAASGSYDVAVTQLAQAEKLKSGGFDTTAAFNTGILAIKTGTNTTTIIKPLTNTLAGIRDAINAATDTDLTATIVSDGTQNHLVLTAKDTGAVNTVKITGTGDFTALQFPPTSTTDSNGVVTTVGMNELTKAQDAKLTVDGVLVTSPTNKVTNAISGVTLTATKVTTADDSLNLNIANDSAGIQSTLSTFVSAYNSLASTLATMTAYNATTKASGPLQGDSSATSIITQLRKTMTAAVTGAGSIATLSDVGVAFQKDGTLAIDTTKVQAAIDGNFAGINTLFTSTGGIATQLTALMTDMLGTTGIIASKTNGLQSSLKTNTAAQTALQTRLDNIQSRYTDQFNALDLTLADMQSTQSYLTQQLAALST